MWRNLNDSRVKILNCEIDLDRFDKFRMLSLLSMIYPTQISQIQVNNVSSIYVEC